jgi:hypothetical protein
MYRPWPIAWRLLSICVWIVALWFLVMTLGVPLLILSILPRSQSHGLW